MKFIRSRQGKHPVLLYDKFAFNQVNSDGRYWVCTMRRKGCKARVCMNEYKTVISLKGEHNHPPPRFHITASDKLKFIRSSRRKYPVLLYDNFTYNQMNYGGRYWACTRKKSSSCKAAIYFCKNRTQIMSIKGKHEHPPPQFHITASDSQEAEVGDDGINEEILKMIQEHGLEEVQHLAFEIKEDSEEATGELLFVESTRGKTVLLHNGHKYRRGYKSKSGIRWVCSIEKQCSAFIYLNDENEILASNLEHLHPMPVIETVEPEQNETAVVITSRKGKEMLLFRQYTYRKQYVKCNRARWVCSTLKNCRACVFTNDDNFIISAHEDHCHDPPKYYLKPNHVLSALREPLIIETD